MRIWKPTMHSLYGFIGRAMPQALRLQAPVARIQQTMVDALADHGARRSMDIIRRIESVEDVQALWYLRDDLMVAMAACHGEANAREEMSRISREFDGLLPPGLASRHSPLGDR